MFFDINSIGDTMSDKSFKIKDIFVDHWDSFVAEGHPIRSAVLKNVDKVIKCGDPSMGHALYFCDHCNTFKHVAFTCKSRFCNSCGAKYCYWQVFLEKLWQIVFPSFSSNNLPFLLPLKQ